MEQDPQTPGSTEEELGCVCAGCLNIWIHSREVGVEQVFADAWLLSGAMGHVEWGRNPQIPASVGAVMSVTGAGAARAPGSWGGVPFDPRCLHPHSIRGKCGGRAGTPGPLQSCAALAPQQYPPAAHSVTGAGAGTWPHGASAATGVSTPDLINSTLKIPMLLETLTDQHGIPASP